MENPFYSNNFVRQLNRFQKYMYVFAVLVLAMWGCSQPTPAPTPIPEDKLIHVLVDVHIAEAALQSLPPYLQDSLSRVYYAQIYEIHDISEKELKESIRILKSDPSRTIDFYARVLEEVDMTLSEIGKEQEEKN